jgi:hypothetical protein
MNRVGRYSLVNNTSSRSMPSSSNRLVELLAPSSTEIGVSNVGGVVEQMEKLHQCDYSNLFSHLPLSFEFSHLTWTNLNAQLQHASLTANGAIGAMGTSTTIDPQLQFQQQSNYKLCFASICILFGCFFCMLGYRCLKVSTFMVGLALGSSIIYLILSEQRQLTLVESLVISLSIGVLFAFVALLVQYIGLFLLGIMSSTALVTCILMLIDLFYTNKSAWLCIGLLFLCATLVASLTLKFQKVFTILNTSCIGSGLLLVAVDFFVENNLLMDYIFELYRVNGNMFNVYERQKVLLKKPPNEYFSRSGVGASVTNPLSSATAHTSSSAATRRSNVALSTISSAAATASSSTLNTITNSTLMSGGNSALALFMRIYSSAHEKLCWYTWLVFGSFFLFLIISLLVQFLITGRSYDHRDSWHKMMIRGSRKKKSANLEKIRLKSNLNDAEFNGAGHHHHQQHHHHHHHHNQHGNNHHRNQQHHQYHHNGNRSHNHRHHNDESSGLGSTSSRTSNSLTRSSSNIELATHQTDTLLLVESATFNTDSNGRTVDSTVTALGISNQKKRRRRDTIDVVQNDNRSAKGKQSILVTQTHDKKVEKEKCNKHSKTPNKANKQINNINSHSATSASSTSSSSTSTSTSTSSQKVTTSSSSSASQSSSTCQLLPTGSNAVANAHATTTTTILAATHQTVIAPLVPPALPSAPPPPLTPNLLHANKQNKSLQATPAPSAPPPTLPTAPAPIAVAGSLIPPPVPALPPPKLPNLLAPSIASQTITTASTTTIANAAQISSSATTASTISSSSSSSLMPVISILTSQQQNPAAALNLAKLKHHRQANSKEKESVNGSATKGDKFRYFYQIRRNNGDVLSQDFMNNVQSKLSSSTNLSLNKNNNNNNNNTNNPITNSELNNKTNQHQQRSSSLTSSDKKNQTKTNNQNK